MLVQILTYSNNSLVRKDLFVRKNKASLTRKVNDHARLVRGYLFDCYGPIHSVIYVDGISYCTIISGNYLGAQVEVIYDSK